MNAKNLDIPYTCHTTGIYLEINLIIKVYIPTNLQEYP